MNRIRPTVKNWRQLQADLKPEAEVNSQERVIALEQFRQQLVATCGEEPSILMQGGQEELSEVFLADYFGWFLKSRHGAIYQAKQGGFRPLAAFGETPAYLQAEAALPSWLAAHGPLDRSNLNLAGLNALEGEQLLSELDRLGAELVVPILINETLWGFITVGPALTQAYDGSEALYLSLYGLSLVSCLDRREKGLLPKAKAAAHRENQILRELQELWVSLRPRHHRIKLLIQDPEQEAAASLTRFFEDWGFEILKGQTHGSDPTGSKPDLILSASSRSLALETPADTAQPRYTFRKPCRFAQLARWTFEAALSLAVKESFPAEAYPNSCLIVDDEEEASFALKEYLEVKGSRVWAAATGEEALTLAKETQPKLIFLDLKLPKLSGAQLLREMRGVCPEAKIIVLTAWAQEYPEESLQKSLQPDGYLLKPVALDTLTQLAEAVS